MTPDENTEKVGAHDGVVDHPTPATGGSKDAVDGDVGYAKKWSIKGGVTSTALIDNV